MSTSLFPFLPAQEKLYPMDQVISFNLIKHYFNQSFITYIGEDKTAHAQLDYDDLVIHITFPHTQHSKSPFPDEIQYQKRVSQKTDGKLLTEPFTQIDLQSPICTFDQLNQILMQEDFGPRLKPDYIILPELILLN